MFDCTERRSRSLWRWPEIILAQSIWANKTSFSVKVGVLDNFQDTKRWQREEGSKKRGERAEIFPSEPNVPEVWTSSDSLSHASSEMSSVIQDSTWLDAIFWLQHCEEILCLWIQLNESRLPSSHCEDSWKLSRDETQEICLHVCTFACLLRFSLSVWPEHCSVLAGRLLDGVDTELDSAAYGKYAQGPTRQGG